MIRNKAEKANTGYGIALKHNRRVEWSGRGGGDEGQRENGKEEVQCSLLLFQLLVVKLSDLDDRRRGAE